MRRKAGVAIAVAATLLRAAPAGADIPRPNLNLRELNVGDWRLTCQIDHASGTLRACALSTMVRFVSIFVHYRNDRMTYAMTRGCLPPAFPDSGYRSGPVAVAPFEQTELWRDFLALDALPVAERCDGTPRGVGGNFTADAETALALLRTLRPLPLPAPPTTP